MTYQAKIVSYLFKANTSKVKLILLCALNAFKSINVFDYRPEHEYKPSMIDRLTGISISLPYSTKGGAISENRLLLTSLFLHGLCVEERGTF